MHRLFPLLLWTSAALTVYAQPNREERGAPPPPTPQVVPRVLVATCDPTGPGSNIVTSVWLPGLGLPDNGTSNITPSNPPNLDLHYGLLMSKNGFSGDCSLAIADVIGFEGALGTEFGFDFRGGGHCGSSSGPRMDVQTPDLVWHYGYCSTGSQSPAGQDAAQWIRVRFTPAQLTPPMGAGQQIRSVMIVFAEGTDAASTEDPNGVGLAVLDNIDVNGTLLRKP